MASIQRVQQTTSHYWRRLLDYYLLPGNDLLYRSELLLRSATSDPKPPAEEQESSAVLSDASQIQEATREVSHLGLHGHRLDSKNWDHLKALKQIYNETSSDAVILDAGGGRYSPLVEWLFLYGYDNLSVVNIDFDRSFQRGPIEYLSGDLTATRFPDDSFDAISSLSVIEHGVPIDEALAELERILKPGGTVVLSTDYWPNKISTDGRETTYGEGSQPWMIFDDQEIEALLSTAQEKGFEMPEWNPTRPNDSVISFNGMGYTFAYLELSLSE